jgi:hypothetical protein
MRKAGGIGSRDEKAIRNAEKRRKKKGGAL